MTTDTAKYNAGLEHCPDAEPMEPHESMLEWRAALWTQMGGHVYPDFGPIRDPHSGDVISFQHKKGTGKYALLEHRLLAASGDRVNGADGHYLRNIYWTSSLYNLYVRGGTTIRESYVTMAAWLRFSKYISWGPRKAPQGLDQRWFNEYVAFATRCYLRHLHCTQSCRWCSGYFAAGAAGLVPDRGV